MSTSSDVPIEELATLSVTPMEKPVTSKVGKVLSSSPAISTKDGLRTIPNTRIEDGKPPTAGEIAAEALGHEADIGSAVYPPVLEKMEVLGYIKDKNGIRYSRDIGRSALIHHEVYFIFGDTCFEDSAGNSVGTTSNTVAYIEDRANLLESEYREISKDGKVKAFVPLNKKEVRFEEQNKRARIVFRMLGGTVDIGILGVVWFQKLVKHENGNEDYCGVGQARLTTYSDGKIVVQRCTRLLFGPNEPKMGSFSTLFHKGHVYLWGDRPDGQIILARVDQYETAHCNEYEYWNGSDWVPRWHDAVPVLHDIQHGAIVHTDLFGEDKPFVFVGVNRLANSMVQIGAAMEIQGPFDLVAVCKATGIDDNNGSKDCIYSHIYPHLWASHVPERELIVTWSEFPPGGVLVAKLKFKIDEVAAVKEAKERKIAAEEREVRRLASIAEEREARDHFGYESDESNDPRPKRDRSEGRLKNGYVMTFVRTSYDPPAPSGTMTEDSAEGS